MFVKTKKPNKVYYDFEQKVHIDDKRTYEVKSSSLIRELIRTGELVEADKPSDAVLKRYAEEDKAAKARKEKSANTGKIKTKEVQLKETKVALIQAESKIDDLELELAGANDKLVLANSEIATLKEAAKKVGDPISNLTTDKKDAVDPKKETTKASNGEKA